jgi:hypothetical protein
MLFQNKKLYVSFEEEYANGKYHMNDQLLYLCPATSHHRSNENTYNKMKKVST